MTFASLHTTEAGAETYVLADPASGATTLLTLGTVAGVELVDDWSGPAAGAEPAAVSIVYFDGPMSPAAYAAGERGGRERIQPALRAVPGVIRQVALWNTDRRSLAVVLFADSVETLDAAGKAVNSTELLPGEDPALLPGPDRVAVLRVAARTRVGDPA